MIKFIIYFVLVSIILLFTIGLRGVSVDPYLSEFEKNKFLLKYGIIVLVSFLSFISFLYYNKKNK